MKKLSAVKLVKEMSRERIGRVRSVGVLRDKRREKLAKILRREERMWSV